MNKEDIQRVNNITGQIIRAESEINSCNFLKGKLVEDTKRFSAKVELEVGDYKHRKVFYLTREEVVPVLERLIKEQQAVLANFTNQLEEIK